MPKIDLNISTLYDLTLLLELKTLNTYNKVINELLDIYYMNKYMADITISDVSENEKRFLKVIGLKMTHPTVENFDFYQYYPVIDVNTGRIYDVIVAGELISVFNTADTSNLLFNEENGGYYIGIRE